MRLVLIFFCILIGLVLISCSSEDVESSPDGNTENPINNAPSIPQLIEPENNLACTYSTVNFEWERSTDSEGDHIFYEFELSENKDFEEPFKTIKISNPSVSLELEEGKHYYWRVLSIDEEGNASDHDEIRSFFTEPSLTYNSIPNTPKLENPLDNATIDTSFSKLEWSSVDSDGDALTFDVYFGISSPPSLIKEDLEESFFEINLDNGTTYYWQIIAKDSHGAKALGPIWKFNVN